MGINCGNLTLLAAYLKTSPDKMGKVLTYGRLHSTIRDKDISTIARNYGVPAAVLGERNTENLFAFLGASEITSMDIDDSEGCDIVFDLTDDIIDEDLLRDDLVGSFNTILDYGTSEHVFDIRQTLVNTWNMLSGGGIYVFDLPITGWTSHCLYQFTPNYFYSIDRSDFFALDWLFFHEKNGDRIYQRNRYDKKSFRLLNRPKKLSAWGILRKVEPTGFRGPLTSKKLKVMQYDVRSGVNGRDAKNRTYDAKSIKSAFVK